MGTIEASSYYRTYNCLFHIMNLLRNFGLGGMKQGDIVYIHEAAIRLLNE